MIRCNWFYVGDGVHGFRRWLFADYLARFLNWEIAKRFDPGLPASHSWNYKIGGRGLYARRNR